MALAGQAAVTPPPIPREFRAAWIATVDNIDWPSKRTLDADQQKAELVHIFDVAAALHLNAVILQVRPSADALYPSKLEPWSEYLTGRQGRPPHPYYDPLQFAVEEAHRRGLELHCWFNPYRAKHPAQKGPLAPNHIAKTHPEVVRKYGSYLWMDPGDPLVQRHTLDVIRDVVHRYDIDGVHIDDYFYPYKENNQDFPDTRSYQSYLSRGGTRSRGDWRRANVDSFIENLYHTIKEEKPWVQFGISPFGIYRPGYPSSIRAGVDQYDELYADTLKWLREGWCDYFTPQLYWPIKQKAQSYPVLLQWWLSQNVKGRHIWPGNYTSRTSPSEGNWKPKEIVDEVDLTRELGANGNVHFSMIALMKNYNGVADALRGGPYAQAALPPESPWLANAKPDAPKLEPGEDHSFKWREDGDSKPMWWAVWRRYGSKWIAEVYPAGKDAMTVDDDLLGQKLNYFGVAAVDRLGNMSDVTAWTPS